MKIYVPFALKLHAYGLNKLFDSNWVHGEFLEYFWNYYISNKNSGLFNKTIRNGAMYLLGCFLFNQYLDPTKQYVVQTDYVRDFYMMLKNVGVEVEGPEMRKLSSLISNIDVIEDSGLFGHPGFRRREFESIALKTIDDCIKSTGKLLIQIQNLYAINYAERVFHDRQLCEHISFCISEALNERFDISDRDKRGCVVDQFGGLHPYNEMLPFKWVNRKNWPKWVIEALKERDKNSCAECGKDFENQANKSNIDHIVPLNLGGTNDLVNLQLLCETCNKSKRDKLHNVNSSIPQYLKSINPDDASNKNFVSRNPFSERWHLSSKQSNKRL